MNNAYTTLVFFNFGSLVIKGYSVGAITAHILLGMIAGPQLVVSKVIAIHEPMLKNGLAAGGGAAAGGGHGGVPFW